MTKRRKKLILWISILLCICLAGGVTARYLWKRWVPKHHVFSSSPAWIRDSVPLISHAGGGIATVDAEGKKKTITYTNSAEAVKSSLANHYKVIEVDLAYTFDGDFALTHAWPEEDTLFMSSSDWKDYRIKDTYTSLTFVDLLQMVKNRPDVYIVTDTKSLHTNRHTEKEFQLIYDQAMAVGGQQLVDRIIPQFYNQEMYETIKKIYPWPSLIYTLYKEDHVSNLNILKFVMGKPDIPVVTMPKRRVDTLFCIQLHLLKKCTYTHTVDSKSKMREYMKQFVDGFYTNAITPKDYIKKYGN